MRNGAHREQWEYENEIEHQERDERNRKRPREPFQHPLVKKNEIRNHSEELLSISEDPGLAVARLTAIHFRKVRRGRSYLRKYSRQILFSSSAKVLRCAD